MEVQVPEGALTDGPLESVVGDFHAAHRSLYGYDSDEAVEMTNLRLAASRSLENPPPLRSARSTAPMEKARLGTTDAYLGPMEGSMEVPQYNGEALSGGHIIPGPCIVLEPYTTIVVPSNWEAAVDAYGNFLLFDVDHRQHYPYSIGGDVRWPRNLILSRRRSSINVWRISRPRWRSPSCAPRALRICRRETCVPEF